LIKQNADRERNNKKGQEIVEVIIGNRVEAPETPRLVHTVMQVSQNLYIQHFFAILTV
jgi:hypothetical protein